LGIPPSGPCVHNKAPLRIDLPLEGAEERESQIWKDITRLFSYILAVYQEVKQNQAKRIKM
jgi:hypothetical protein